MKRRDWVALALDVNLGAIAVSLMCQWFNLRGPALLAIGYAAGGLTMRWAHTLWQRQQVEREKLTDEVARTTLSETQAVNDDVCTCTVFGRPEDSCPECGPGMRAARVRNRIPVLRERDE